MSDLKNQRRIAAAVLGCGANRIWIDPERMEDVQNAISRDDIRGLIEEGAVRAHAVVGVSRGRARIKAKKRSYGHCKGSGRRKGAAGARDPGKRQWIRKIRAIRRTLREMRDEGTLDAHHYRIMYRRAAGGQFRSVAHVKAQVEAQTGREQ